MSLESWVFSKKCVAMGEGGGARHYLHRRGSRDNLRR